jgi:hypothetical protein
MRIDCWHQPSTGILGHSTFSSFSSLTFPFDYCTPLFLGSTGTRFGSLILTPTLHYLIGYERSVGLRRSMWAVEKAAVEFVSFIYFVLGVRPFFWVSTALHCLLPTHSDLHTHRVSTDTPWLSCSSLQRAGGGWLACSWLDIVRLPSTK